MSGSQEDFFGGSSYPALSFKTMGDGYKGTLIDNPRPIERPNLTDGSLEWQLPINLEVDGENRTLWVRAGTRLSSEIRKAYTDAGVPGLAKGGTLTVAWIDTAAPKNPAHSPAKVYRAKYVPPAEVITEGEAAVAATASSIFDD